ncbi:MAG TPA: metallopeptidase TldD-related protein [Thermoanaerobaculia bacterium]|nr:metallopeptidase TldD-related protein [Thermoanaerobaculia bacterium]
MSGSPRHEETLRGLLRCGLPEAELFVKRGRTRRLAVSAAAETSVISQERAWAVRAGTRRSSFFMAGTGEPPEAGPWPQPEPGPLRLPEPLEAPPWNEPSDFDAPLVGEREGLTLLASLGRELAAELPGARLEQAALEDGSSEGELASSRGVRARFRHRIATLYLEAVGPGRPGAAAALYLAAREARRFHPSALARRLADRLAVQASGGPPEKGGGELLLAPPVGVALLAALLPLLVGPGAAARLAGLRDRRGRIGSELLTLVDNGRLAGGAFECPIDGEGVPTAEVVLVEKGTFRQPLLAWWQADGAAPGLPSGCSRRPGWRDLPLPGPTHLYLAPDPRAPVAALLGEVAHGYYLIDATGAGSFDLAGDRFALPVCGFAVDAGRASAPVARVVLCGSIGALLKGIVAVGRDLSFHPLAGMIGAPTMLVRGLELHGAG